MIITLYQNCKLNNKYKDIFYNKTFLENYLSSLTNRIVLNDDDVFSRNNDIIYVDPTGFTDFKQYNYIKIVDSIGTFYAFINNIRWVNEIYAISYEEDIMSNYIEDIRIRNSLLTGCKSLKLYKGQEQKTIKYYNYPVLPDGNNRIKIERYYDFTPNTVLIVKLQLYKLTSQGVPNERIPLIGKIRYYYDGSFSPNSYNYFEKIIEHLINKMAIQQVTYNNDTYFYEIDKIYMIPSEFIAGALNYGENIELFVDDQRTFYFSVINTHGNDYTEYRISLTINYDRTIKSVGLFNMPIEIINNGTGIYITISFYVSYYDLTILFNVQNRMIDVTEKFVFDLPYKQANSSEVQLQRMQLNMQNNELMRQIQNENVEIARIEAITPYDASSAILGSVINAEMAGSQELGGVSGAYSRGNFGSLLSLPSTTANALFNERVIQNNIDRTATRIEMLNRKVYSSSSINNNKISYINALFGLCIFKIQEDNTTQVEQSVKLSGYKVRELVNDVIRELDINNLTDNYEVFKFDDVNVYGIIAQDYVDIIEKILLSGVRIWCQDDIGEII